MEIRVGFQFRPLFNRSQQYVVQWHKTFAIGSNGVLYITGQGFV